MATLFELTHLFSQLAANLQQSTDTSAKHETAKLISSIAAYLNSPSPSSSVRVLDAALSLMCFNTPQILGTRIDCLVGTIVSVLSAVVHCDLGSGRVGSLISAADCAELIRIGADLVQNMEGHFGSSSETIHALFHVILRATLLSSNYEMLVLSTSINTEENERTKAGMRTEVAKLIRFLPDGDSNMNGDISLRLLLWYLNPLILKHDILEILRETTERPFLCLKKELRARESWRSVIICFVNSPTMFLKTRELLHGWFFLTDPVSVLNLQIALISSVLDVLSRPMWWGVSLEMGSKFLFSYAYFPKKHCELLSILTGPISCECFLNLVHHIQTAASPPSKCSNLNDIHISCAKFGHGSAANVVDNNSIWSMLMGFPAWFYFAAILVFHGKDSQDSFLSRAVFSECEADSRNVICLREAAAFYLSWVLNPLDETCVDLFADRIRETSRSWSMKSGATFSKKQSSHSETLQKKMQTRNRKLMVSKVLDCEKLQLAVTDDSASAVGEWLKEYDGSCVDVCSKAISSQISPETKDKHSGNVQLNPLPLRIPLGILITSSYMEEKGCELLLHYATTGEIQQSREMPGNALGCFGHDHSLWFGGSGSTWPIGGAHLVFNLFEVLEDMSVMLFVCEDTRATFICQMKGKVSGYLLRCIKALLELSAELFQDDEIIERAMEDLYQRLTEWMQGCQEVFEEYKAFNEVVNDFARRFAIAKGKQDL